jgi:HEAT repeat protein
MLGKLKTQAASATGALIEAAQRDPVPQVRGVCLVAISQIAEPDEAIPAYREGLSDADAAVRLVAAARLRQLGPAAVPARQELGKALEDADERVANAAAETLVQIGPPAIATLINSLDARPPTARKLALACLAKLGPAAKDAVPSIEKRLKDDDAEVRKLAEIALARIQGK